MIDEPTAVLPGDADSERICWCMRVHEATLRRAIAAGATTLAALAARTRAGTGCGTCRSELLRLLDEAARERAKRS